MSASSEIKETLINDNKKPCCQCAELFSAVLCTGTLNIDKNGIGFSVTSTSQKYIKKIVHIIDKLFSYKINEISIIGILNKKNIYCVNVGGKTGENILIALGIINKDKSLRQDMDQKIIFPGECCKKSALIGAFIASGSVIIPSGNLIGSSKKGYHLEITFNSENSMNFYNDLFNYFGFYPKSIYRKEKYVLYFKASETISDILTFFGAHGATLSLQSNKAMRAYKNDLNRQYNCLSANTDRAINASFKQLSAIEKIQNTVGLESLPEKLREVAELRLENKDMSIDALRLKLKEPISKSGINHRFEKLIETAENLLIEEKEHKEEEKNG